MKISNITIISYILKVSFFVNVIHVSKINDNYVFIGIIIIVGLPIPLLDYSIFSPHSSQTVPLTAAPHLGQ